MRDKAPDHARPSDRDVESFRGGFLDVNQACTAWLHKRGLLGNNFMGTMSGAIRASVAARKKKAKAP